MLYRVRCCRLVCIETDRLRQRFLYKWFIQGMLSGGAWKRMKDARKVKGRS